jgi:hypothetical protein
MRVRVSALVLISLAACGGGWETKEKKSEMSGEVIHSISRDATDKISRGGKSFSPWFAFIVRPKQGYEFLFSGREVLHRGNRYGSVELRLKFSDEKIRTLPGHEVDGRPEVYSIVVPDSLLGELRNATGDLLVEYEVAFAGKQIAHFPMKGFQKELDRLCANFTRECARSL